MKTIVISEGFIGKHLVSRLKDLGHNVTVYHHDDKLNIDKADFIFFLSSYGNHYQQKDEFKTIKANIIDLFSLLKTTKHINYKGLVHFSTSSVILPIQTLYSETKFIAELFCRRFARKHHKNTVSIRPTSVYGPGEALFRFIPTVIRCMKEDKPLKLSEGWHDWVFIEDFVDGVIKVMENVDKLVGKTVTIGTGKQYSNRDIVDMLLWTTQHRLTIKEVPKLRDYDNNNWIADTTLIKSLGWSPKTDIFQGLKKTYDRFTT